MLDVHIIVFFLGGGWATLYKIKNGGFSLCKKRVTPPPLHIGPFYIASYIFDVILFGWFNRRPYKVVCHQMV